jgi:(acyl-carrier-protein) S-malonyltransferase
MKSFAFVFPGQGSQSVGMLDAWGDHPVVAQVLQEASDALGEDLALLIQQGPKEALALTTNTQPVMLVAGVPHGACGWPKAGPCRWPWPGIRWASIQRWWPPASDTGTGSAAGALARRSHARGRAGGYGGHGSHSGHGGVPGDCWLRRGGCILWSGIDRSGRGREFQRPDPDRDRWHQGGCGQGLRAAQGGGCQARAAAARVGTIPFQPDEACRRKLRMALSDVVLAVPQIPVLNNVDVAVQQDADAIRDALYRQAFGAVRWVECVQALKGRGITHIIECGPGKVLAGLTKRIDPELVGAALFDPATLAETRELLA